MPQLKIDHVTLAGARLQEMCGAFLDATGIRAEYGGAHSNHATEMALASFPDGSYVELIAIQPQADPAAVKAHLWARSLRDHGGPCAFALNVADLNVEIQRIASAGIHVGNAEQSGRIRPDGVVLSWETASIGSGPPGSFFPFLIHDSTARENRVYPSGSPTSRRFSGVGLVVISVRNLEASIAGYRKAFPLPAPKLQRDENFGADLAWFEGTAVMLAGGLTPDNWLARRAAFDGDSPCAFVLAGASAMTGAAIHEKPSKWFGREVFWATDTKLGGRIGTWD